MEIRIRNILYYALFLSLLLHLSVFTGLSLSDIPDFLKKEERVEIVVLDQRQAEKMMRIVEQNEKPLNDEVPEDAKFLSAHNQRVVKETRAQNHGDFKNSAGRGDQGRAQEQKVANRKSGRKILNKGTIPSLADLRPKYDFSKKVEDTPASHNSGEASQTNDYLKDTPPSLETVLNTREFVYYSYYQRIREKIRQFWEPSIREKVKKIFAQGRHIASEKDHITRVIIILDKDGELMGVQIVGESGLKDLDDAAVEAFRAAEPFPNPPKGIVEQDGKIRINWDFILEASNTGFVESQRYARHW